MGQGHPTSLFTLGSRLIRHATFSQMRHRRFGNLSMISYNHADSPTQTRATDDQTLLVPTV